MIDYDVMVFVRYVPTFCISDVASDVIYNGFDSAILIMPFKDYKVNRDLIIGKFPKYPITEIQLIKSRAGITTLVLNKRGGYNVLH